MPQRKQEVNTHVAPWRLVHAEALKFIARWNGGPALPQAVRLLCRMATDPRVLLRGGPFPPPDAFARAYAVAPDFTIGLLAHLRKKWNQLNASKAGQLQIFMATHPAARPADVRHAQFLSELSDCQVATAYQRETGKSVSTADVVKARKALLARYTEADNLKV